MAAKITPLLRFLRAFPTKSERKAFAEAVGTTELYLYQIAAQECVDPMRALAEALRRVRSLKSPHSGTSQSGPSATSRTVRLGAG